MTLKRLRNLLGGGKPPDDPPRREPVIVEPGVARMEFLLGLRAAA